MKIAFDIDDTLYKIRLDKRDQIPDYDLIQVLKWFHKNGDEVYVWSAGGLDYAKTFVRKLGLDDFVTVIRKRDYRSNDIPEMDIAFDDCETNLAKVDILVRRESTVDDIMSIAKPNCEKFTNEENLI